MTNSEAAFLLGAFRPNGADSADPEFSEALAQAAREPELKAWFDNQRRTDAAIAARLQALPVPADLRSRILTGGRASRPVSWFSPKRIWAIAAVVALFAGIGLWVTMSSRRASGRWEDQAIAAVSAILSGKEKFDVESPSVAELQTWLRANGSPSSALPPAVGRLSSLGCKTLSWNGHTISIICFHGPGGELVHLAMVDRAALSSPPPLGHPEFETRDGWRMACWSQGDTAMMLVTRAPESQLRALLGMVLLL